MFTFRYISCILRHIPGKIGKIWEKNEEILMSQHRTRPRTKLTLHIFIIFIQF